MTKVEGFAELGPIAQLEILLHELVARDAIDHVNSIHYSHPAVSADEMNYVLSAGAKRAESIISAYRGDPRFQPKDGMSLTDIEDVVENLKNGNVSKRTIPPIRGSGDEAREVYDIYFDKLERTGHSTEASHYHVVPNSSWMREFIKLNTLPTVEEVEANEQRIQQHGRIIGGLMNRFKPPQTPDWRI